MAIELSKLSAEQIAAYKEAGALDAIIEGAKNDVSSTVGWARPVYAPNTGTPSEGGIFTAPGVRPDMFSTLGQPMDITSILNPTPSEFAQERVGVLTGQLDTSGTNPDDSCGEPVRPGALKTCQQNYSFGEFYMGSNKMKISDAGMIANRAVTPRRILNEAQTNPFLPSVLQGANVDFQSIEAQQLFQLGTAMRRAVSVVAITGNPATAAGSAEPGFIREFTGLDNLIVTGHTDAVTGETCPAVDSVVVSFSADVFTGTDALSGRKITAIMTDMYFGRQTVAMQLGVTATWAWVMPFALFRELTYAYANQYYETRSPGVVGNPFQTQQEGIKRLQVEMLNGYYLLMDGVPVPVLFSDGIPLEVGGGNYKKADIFLLATSVQGRSGLQFEYFNIDNPYARQLRSRFNGELETLNGGMYLLGAERSFDCMELRIVGKMRMWHEAPFLCGKIQDLLFVSNINYRSPLPGVTGYVNGGTFVLDVNV